MSFTRNMGRIDRIIRFTLGAAFILLAATDTIDPWGWIGIVPLATAFISFCPLYTFLGFKTCSDC